MRELIYSTHRFNLLCSPTGSGKSATYMSVAGVDDGRMAVLTATKQLQDQLFEDFRKMGLVDMRGRNNYDCDVNPRITAADAFCTAGVYCSLMKGGCKYYDKRRAAGESRLTTTNYRFWLHDEESSSLGKFDTIVLDEAHRAPDEIAEFAAVEVSAVELRMFYLPFPKDLTRGQVSKRQFDWANLCLLKMEALMMAERDHERRRRGKNLERKLARLCRLSDSDWIGSKPKRDVWRWDLLEPGKLAEELLFRGARRIILASASVRRKTLQLLGVHEKVELVEQESTFPVTRRPIYYWPVARVGRSMTPADRAHWLDCIDEVIDSRRDRNGIIHAHSYALGQEIYDRSEHKDLLMLHKQGRSGADVFDEFVFRGRRRPTVLLSPAFTTGADFAYSIAEYQIIPKCPFPDFRSPLVSARAKLDSDYVSYVTIQTIVQAAGRVDRAPDDQGETIIMDGNFGWLRGANWDFAPRYFHNAVRTIKSSSRLPDPPPKLSKQGVDRVSTR